MTYLRWWEDDDALHEDSAGPSANEQLLRYVGMRELSAADVERSYLKRADASYLGTDFP